MSKIFSPFDDRDYPIIIEALQQFQQQTERNIERVNASNVDQITKTKLAGQYKDILAQTKTTLQKCIEGAA